MDRKSKILLYIFFFLFVGTVMFAFARYMIFRDFEIMMSEEEEAVSEEPVMETVPEEGIDPENAESLSAPEETPSL